ncbi:hypothetical protein PTSG_08651 [Salpingoeca rosetta]|uniref:TIP41-like protein n=1 Tax=Salpingoeca rosetta (strain ATCC 50818 / BSB-021) TaxID=946362 RepID=F2UKA4_SALR5|nr:uncharacterized protein PTSG_08651 [Salpingoeca rosetta]EGD77553.1 hypothetical protein PTSG_08651 [Salpingoeca rosetta]|eukprot:XP_004990441.1 hypothetical protein PTSG_08651 [Salpingoeca rosetta]
MSRSFKVDDVWAVTTNKQHMLESRCHFQCASKQSSGSNDEHQQQHQQQQAPASSTASLASADVLDHGSSAQRPEAQATEAQATEAQAAQTQHKVFRVGGPQQGSKGEQGPVEKRGKRMDLLTQLVQQPEAGQLCDFCQFEQAVPFPLPEEVYSRNHVTLWAGKDHSVRFDALGALQGVQDVQGEHELPQVSYAKEWKHARRGRADKLTPVKPYDWTYNTRFAGSLHGSWLVEPTEEGIDFNLLRQPEKILFQEHVFLLADDYSDNGIMHMDVRLRAMPSCLYLLQRQFIRVDHVMVRIHDTRVFKRTGCNHLIRECSTHEVDIPHLDRTAPALPDGRPLHVLCTPTDVGRAMQHFRRTRFERSKLTPQ